MNIAAIRLAFHDALDATNLFGSVVSRQDTPVDALPAAVLQIETAEPAVFADASWTVTASVIVLVSKADNPDGWETLDTLLSDETLADALSDMTIAASVATYDQIGQAVEHRAQTYLAFTATVTVVV